MKLYVYCLSDEATPQMCEGVRGIADAHVFTIRHGGLACVVSRYEGERVAVTPEDVRAHNRVNAHLLAWTTPLPSRFGMLVTEAQLQTYAEANTAALVAALEGVRGAVEMSVRIMWDREAVKREAAGASPDVGAEEGAQVGMAEAGRVKTGTAFLAAKRRAIRGEEFLKRRSAEIDAWLAAAVAGAVRASSVRVEPGASLVLSAAHLVERGRLDEYRALLDAARREGQARNLRFLTSGPWPPYSFSNINP